MRIDRDRGDLCINKKRVDDDDEMAVNGIV